MPLLKKQPFFKLWIVLTMIVAYLPISSFYFAVKNDFFTGYFPAKLFLSEQIQLGNIPTWNPFINYGFPIYGDMSLGYWSPSNWFFGALGYNPYSFTAELLMYILISGYGMFLVSGLWLKSKAWRYVFAVAYMCSGFNVSHVQHFNWITASALLPYCFYFLYKLMHSFNLKYLLTTAFFFSFYISSVHPGMIIGGLLFFSILSLKHIVDSANKRKSVISLLFLLSCLTVLSCGIFWAYASILPYTNRSGSINLDQINDGATVPSSWISLLFPFPSMDKNAIMTSDIALRSSYMGLLPLAALASLFRKGNHTNTKFYFFIGVAFVMLSAPVLAKVYHFIPLINTVRLRAEFRLFAIFAFLLTAIHIIYSRQNSNSFLLEPLRKLLVFIIIITLGSIILLLATQNSIIFNSPLLDAGFIPNLKAILHSLSFADKIVIQGIIQISFIVTYIANFNSAGSNSFWKTSCVEFVISTLLCMPFTGVGMHPLKKVSELIASAPKQSIILSNTPEKDIVSKFPVTDSTINSWSFYSKQIAQEKPMLYPLVLKNTEKFFSSGEQNALLAKPIYFSELSSNISLISNSVTRFSFRIQATQIDTIVIKQNYFDGWQGYLNGKKTDIFPIYQTCIGMAVEAGEHIVTFEYENKAAICLLILYQLLMAGLSCFIIFKFYRIRYILP
jgi:hypothetical protein